MTDEQRMISQLAERKITVFVKNQTFEQHSVFTHFHSCNLNLYLKKTRLIAHTYTQRHRSKRKEKTYTKAVITHTLHTPSGNSKTNSVTSTSAWLKCMWPNTWACKYLCRCNYVCDRVCLWKFESMSKISYIIHVFCQLVFPSRRLKHIQTLDSGGVGGWGCLGSYTMNLEEGKK